MKKMMIATLAMFVLTGCWDDDDAGVTTSEPIEVEETQNIADTIDNSSEELPEAQSEEPSGEPLGESGNDDESDPE